MKNTIFSFIFIFSLNTYADITGIIFEKGKKIKKSNINVYIPVENLMAVTDQDGMFVLKTNSLTAEVKINASGFYPLVKIINANQPENIFLEKKPEKKSLSLTVEDANYKKDQSVKSLTRQQIFDMPGANGDVIKAVQNLPGVNRAQGFSSQIIVQGSAPKDTNYDFDGHEIPLVFHFGGLSSVVMPEAIEKVDFYSAGFQAEHSRALGGIISLLTRKPEVADRDSKGLFYVDNLSAGGLFESKINDRSQFLISGRYSYIGFFLKSAIKDQETLNLTVAPEFYDMTAIYNYQIADNENLKISFISSNDKLAFVLNEPLRQDPSIRGTFSNTVSFFRIVPTWEKIIDADNLLFFSFAYGVDKLNVDIGSNFLNLERKSFSTRSRWEHKINSDSKIKLGWDNIYSNGQIKIRLPVQSGSGGINNPVSSGETREADINIKSNSPGFFSELEYQANLKLKIIPGIRADYFSLTKEFYILPRLALQYKADDSLVYKLGSGMYVQPSEGQESSKDFGNPDIKSPQAIHLTLGFDKNFKNGNSDGNFFSSNSFYRKFDRLVIQSAAKKIVNGNEVFEIYNNEGTGAAYGIENQWKYQNGDYQLVLGYTWSKSVRKSPSQAEYNFEYDQTHNLNLINSYQISDSWKISSRYRYVTGNPYTPVVGAIYDADNEIYFPLRGNAYSERNQAFQQLDLRLDKKIILDQEIWTFYLDIQNVVNSKNSEGIQYSYDYSQREDVMGLPLLPSIGLKGEF